MRVFCHHLYEYRKGLRNLILHTASGAHRAAIERQLQRNSIDYLIYPLTNGRVNVFFGADDCVAVIRAIGKRSLTDYTPEEDFMLGTMLGYDRVLQCQRYLRLHRCGRPEEAELDLEESLCCAEASPEGGCPAEREASHVA